MKFKKEADKLYSKLLKEEVDGKIKYFRKREVFPILDEEGSIKWFNFITGGSILKLIITLVIIGILVGFIFEYHNNLQTCADLMNDMNIKQNITNFLRGVGV